MVKITNADKIPGTIVKGDIQVGGYADGGKINMPVWIITGIEKGPTLWIQACTHGEEYGGAAGIINVMQSLDPRRVKGTIIAVPAVELPSYSAKARIFPLDGENLNRLFQVNIKGNYNRQLVAALMENILNSADYLLELHSGGYGSTVPFYSIYADGSSAVAQAAKRLAKSVGAKVVWKTSGAPKLIGVIAAQAALYGIPAVAVQTGGDSFAAEHLYCWQAINNMMKAVGVLSGEPARLAKYIIISGEQLLFSKERGLFVRHCNAGDILHKGDVIGYIINFHGETVAEVINPVNNAYIAALYLNYVPCDAGDPIAEVVSIENEEI